MRALLDVYVQQFKTTLASQLQYRAALAIWMLGHVLDPLIYLVVWSTVARSSGGSVGGFDASEFAAYFVLMLVNHATFSWLMWEYDYRIRHGTLSFALLRPVHPIHADIADNVSFKLLTFVLLLPTAAGLAVAFRPAFHLVPWAVAAFIPALMLAFVVRFLVEWTLALAAFWTTRVSAINQMYFRGAVPLRAGGAARVECRLRLGSLDDLAARLKSLGLSGSINTAFVERINLTLRHALAALSRRS